MRVAGLAPSEGREEAQILPCWSRTLGPLSGDSGLPDMAQARAKHSHDISPLNVINLIIL